MKVLVKDFMRFFESTVHVTVKCNNAEAYRGYASNFKQERLVDDAVLFAEVMGVDIDMRNAITIYI